MASKHIAAVFLAERVTCHPCHGLPPDLCWIEQGTERRLAGSERFSEIEMRGRDALISEVSEPIPGGKKVELGY